MASIIHAGFAEIVRGDSTTRLRPFYAQDTLGLLLDDIKRQYPIPSCAAAIAMRFQ
jgi:hypothetical protein